ncbi:glycosyl transferase family 2 [Desulfofarcimen acetoxidans DSM 771]|uniref:Glycosyl transferase family 2 n=1 Tax=Desulfofarcimen acetoxidans (strain ATCC 49208 / DSM 771 / KCTC 5769 / VKM B-1644 / 5575) TaxID=485916 RepID=C8VYT9_DESAS|nr:glycosyltransferase family 2 protein [Desulfofarcimen acetoxidans]ACV64810.1 glycosyl transferase family 2 [Desulfofarcimen acetoxidans DSM 771]
MKLIKLRISVIIPTLNGANDLSKLLNQIKVQTTEIDEVIVIDSQSTDDTVQKALQLGAKVLQIPKHDFDHGGTRNFAAKKAIGDILVFMTQDAVPYNNHTIENLLLPLANPETIVSYGRQIPKPGTKITDQFLRLYNYPQQSLTKDKKDINAMGIKTFQNSNVCAAYRRLEFNKLGGFPNPVVSNEDMLFAAKAIMAGYKVVYAADALVLHSHNYSYINLFKRYFDIAASLEHEPIIKNVGRAEAKGYDFLIEQFKFLRENNRFLAIFQASLEAIFKYAGYKLGEKNNCIPMGLKKYLGLNKNYWDRQLRNKC